MRLLCLFIMLISAVICQLHAQVPTLSSRIVLVVDVGPDDAFALLVLLNAEKMGRVRLEAVVCTMGNSDVTNTCKNVANVLAAAKRTDIPVFRGSSEPIVPLPKDTPGLQFFGKDGFGDLNNFEQPDLEIIQDVPASIALHELVHKNPYEITLVSVAPLTTSGLTELLFEDFVSKLKQIWIMGGNFEGPGNITEDAEFNFFIDPESARIILQHSGRPVMLLTWDACLDIDITLDWRFNVLGKKESPVMSLLNAVEHKVYQNTSWDSVWAECDAFTAIAAIHPETVLNKSNHRGIVELHNNKTRGRLVFNNNSDNPEIIVIEKINSTFVKEVLLDMNY